MTVKTLRRILKDYDGSKEVLILTATNGSNFDGFVGVQDISKSIEGPHIKIDDMCLICADDGLSRRWGK